MTIFSPQDTQLARERLSRFRGIEKPTGFVENFRAAWNDFSNNDAVGSEFNQRREFYNDQSNLVRNMTGEKLENPYSFRFDRPSMVPDFLQAVPEMLDEHGGWTYERRVREYHERADKLRESLPLKDRVNVFSRDEIDQILKSRAQAFEKKRQETGATATMAGTVGQFGGTAARAMLQPEVLVTLPLGAPLRAGLMTRILTEAGIGAATEAALQPEVQRQRESLGVEFGPEQAWRNIIGAGIGTAGLTTGVIGIGMALGLVRRGGAKAFEKMAGRSATAEERAVIDAYQNDIDVETLSPFEERSPAALAATRENEQKATAAVLAGESIDDTDLFVAPLVSRSMDENGDGYLDVLGGEDVAKVKVDAEAMQFKSDADAAGVTSRLEGVKDWDKARAGIALIYELEDGTRIVADGHQRLSLAQRLHAKGEKIEMPAIIYRQADGMTAEKMRAIAALKNIAEESGTRTDAALVLRNLGKSIEELNLPPKSALARDAEGLRLLSDEAFKKIHEGKLISERHGAIIGRLVKDARLHAPIVDLLHKTKPANEFEAEMIVRQAQEAGVTRTKQETLFGDEEVAESLYLERARLLNRALKKARRLKEVFRTVDESSDVIESEGNILDRSANVRRLAEENRVRAYLAASAHKKGFISDALTKAARQAKETGNYSAAADEFLAAVRSRLERGDIDSADVVRSRTDMGLEREASEVEADPSVAEQVGDDVLKDFDEPAGKASEEQADRIAAEIEDDAVEILSDVDMLFGDVRSIDDVSPITSTQFQEAIDAANAAQRLRDEDAIRRLIPSEDHKVALRALKRDDGGVLEDLADKHLGFEGANREEFDRIIFGKDEPDRFIPFERSAQREIQEALDDAEGLDEIGKEGLARLLTDLPDRDTPPMEWTNRQKAAWLAFARVAQRAGDEVVDTAALSRELGELAARRFPDPEDADFMLGRFFQDTARTEPGAEGKPQTLIGQLKRFGYSDEQISTMTGVQKRDSLFAMRLMETRLQDRAIMRATDAEEFGEHVDLMRELDADVASGRFVQPQNTPEFRPPKTNKSIEKIKEAAADTLEFYDGDKARAIKELREDIGDGKIIEGHHNVLFEDIAKELESPAGTLTVRAEPGAEGKPQTLVEGVRPVTDADRIALEAERALTGEAKPLDIGLFGPERDQLDIMDMEIPMRERIDADGNRVVEKSTIRETLDDLEEAQEFYEQLKLCDRPGNVT